MTTGAANRIDGIDFWPGFALRTMFIDHLPENIFQYVTLANFGFSDAAELFVFLSGASVALAHGSRFFRGETAAANQGHDPVSKSRRDGLSLLDVRLLQQNRPEADSRTATNSITFGSGEQRP